LFLFSFGGGGMLHQYVGRIVEIIYLDRNNKLTQRLIEVRSIEGDTVKAYCLKQQAPRLFKLANILAVEPISSKRSG
jgi:predicted DNA-binding transcriptional regulator YafY